MPMRALGELSPRQIRERAEGLLDSLGLADHRHKRPDQISGGQRQRVAVARALANEPAVILADEPTGNLDTKSSDQVFAILRDLVDEQGTTVVAVTHSEELAGRMDRHVHLVDGRIVSDNVKKRVPAS
jgi:lipoprotein-releasing system ATP-binding protein